LRFKKIIIITIVYAKFSKHLGKPPSGFPATDSGVEIRILKRLFTEKEAAIALGFTMVTQPVYAIAERLEEEETSNENKSS